MRRLVWLGLILALLWSGWWVFAAFSIQDGLDAWLADRRSEGWQAEVADRRVAGYPLAFDTRVDAPALADPQTGLAFNASGLALYAPAYAPGQVTVSLPQDEIILATPFGARTVLADAAKARLSLSGGGAAEVAHMSLTSDAWQLLAPAGMLMSAEGLTLQMDQDEADGTLYHFGLESPAFQPGDVPRRAARIPADWPSTFDSLVLDMTVRFDRPIDRRTVEDRRPQPRRIDLRVAEAAWGDLSLRFSAALDVSDDGRPTGEFAVQARNWRTLVDVAENTGTLPARLRPQVEQILEALARGGGNAEALDVTLTLRNGDIFLGFIPLGSVAPLVIR